MLASFFLITNLTTLVISLGISRRYQDIIPNKDMANIAKSRDQQITYHDDLVSRSQTAIFPLYWGLR